MNNQVSKLLDFKFPEPNHSNFNLGRKNTFSADVGYLYPCYVEECLPNSYKRLDLEALVQCNSTIAPVMGSFTVKVDAFFVPIRLYHKHLLSNDRANGFTDDFQFHYIPWLSYHLKDSYGAQPNKNLVVSPGCLLEYLGVFPAHWNSNSWGHRVIDYKPLNAYPFIGYFDIFRNYYSNPYDTKIPFRVNNSFLTNYQQLDVVDRYVELNKFDIFITTIRNRSQYVSDSNNSLILDRSNVLQIFNDVFTYTDKVDDVSYTYSIPLFANQQAFNANYTDNALHFGLLRRTYKDDYFNARVSTEYVNYLKSQSRVVVSSNGTNTGFDITSLRLANRVAKYVDKLGLSDSRFGSWLKAHFGTRLNDRLDIPQFLGSISSTLAFDDIISNAQTGNSDSLTSNQALGSRAAIGSSYVKNDGAFVEFKCVEPGYLMCLFSIVPNVSYYQGIRKLYLKNRFSDLYTPEFDAVGYQDLHKIELAAIGYTEDITGVSNLSGPLDVVSYNTAVGKQPAWLEYMTSIDESHGLMQSRLNYGYWVLNRPFDINAYKEIFPSNTAYEPVLNTSTYIFPEFFNNIFAVNKVTDNFQVQMRWFDKTSQPMSKQILPHL